MLPIAQSKDLALYTTLLDKSKSFWIGDENRFRQIIFNLVSNAIKFTEKGSVSLSLSINDAQALIVHVSDTGIGMSSEDEKKLFKRFEQSDGSITRRYGGSGLGMAISHHLASLMNGSFDVISELNLGTSITLTLPLEQSKQEPQEQKSDEISIPDLSGVNILLAEDNAVNQTIFSAIMKKTSASITIAKNGQEAFEFALKDEPKLVFMDIQMPVMDGIESCKLIKNQYPDMPIIALTANVMDSDVKTYYEHGFDHWIAKPIIISELYAACHKYLS